jgi:hypothetical protein
LILNWILPMKKVCPSTATLTLTLTLNLKLD